MLYACDKKMESEQIIDDDLEINLSLGMNQTKVTDTAFESGDQAGIYVVNHEDGVPGELASSGNHYDNVRFTLSGGWNGDQTMYWADKSTKVDFYCYSPYGNPSDVNAYTFALMADQSIESNYKASDFVWGKAAGVSPTKETVQIETNHIMSSAAIYVKAGDGFTGGTFGSSSVSLKVKNVKTSASIDLSDGTVTATGATADVTPFDAGECYRALIIPQTVASGTELIEVTVDGVSYVLKKGFTFVSGKRHKFTVTVNKTGNGINIGIRDWEEDEEDNGGSAE